MGKQKVTKAVVAAAGFGTRFLPQTKAIPKEMLPVVDQPIVNYVVDELVKSGITTIIFVVGPTKKSLEDYFDVPASDLVANIKAGGPKKRHYLDEVCELANLANFFSTRQKGPYGNATPLMNAASFIGDDEPFIYTFADDFISAKPLRFKQMIEAYQHYGTPILSCIRATKDEDYDRYGFVAGDRSRPGLLEVKTIVEKPGKENAPSDQASVSSFLFTGRIFPHIQDEFGKLQPGTEFCLQPAVQAMIDDGQLVYALEIANAIYHDCGNPLEYIKTVLYYAAQRDDLQGGLFTSMAQMLASDDSELYTKLINHIQQRRSN